MSREIKKQRGIFERPTGSGVWWICYYDQYSQKHREKVGMRSAAVKTYQQRKTEIRQAKFEPQDVKRKDQNATVKDIVDDYLKAYEGARRRAIKDTRIRASYWKDIWLERAARSIVPSDVEHARLELARSQSVSNNKKKATKGRSPATVNRYLAALKAAFSLAVRNGKVERNPVSLVKMSKENNKRVRYLAEDEENRLFAAVPKEYHPLAILSLHTGMRKGELLNLKWEDIDFKQKRLMIRESKAGEARHLPMNDFVIQILQCLPRMLHNPYVFYGRNPGDRLKNGIKNTAWKKYLKEAGIENFHWHDLRHTFASRLVMKGINLYTVSKLLGHHSLDMTERYAHLAPDYLQKAVEVLAQVTPELTPAANGSPSASVSNSFESTRP